MTLRDWATVLGIIIVFTLVLMEQHQRYLSERRERQRLELTLAHLCYEVEKLGFVVHIRPMEEDILWSHEITILPKEPPVE